MTATATMSAPAWLEGLLDALGSGRPHPGSTLHQCPAHPDTSPSLSVGAGRDGRAILHCHRGCPWSAVLAALGIPQRYLFSPPPVDPAAYARELVTDIAFPPMAVDRRRSTTHAGGFRLEGIHAYPPNHRVLRHRNSRDDKTLTWETRRRGTWLPGLFGMPTAALPIYDEAQVRMAVAAAEPVLLVESESSVDRLVKAGWYATTWAGGAASVQVGALNAVLRGYPHIVVIPDNDPAGLAALAFLTAAGLAPHVLMPDEGDDARDLIEKVGPDQFRELVAEARR